jgi:glutamyl-tRNA synthetase
MADRPRVRFSPAPTGSLHVGGARTALFNWLYARHHDGEFLLRIEDTDASRSKPEWVAGIEDVLRWLGIDWDGDPVRQSTRFDRYREAASKLLAEGRAYECFCTSDEVKARGDAARAQGRPPGYDGHCRDLDEEQRASLRAEGREPSIRFRTPDTGSSTFTDAIRGEVSVEWANIPDFVIVRSDGNPLFFLANAVDDLDMGITHVIRGEDLIDTTHRVLALREALGAPGQPVYAHLPLILAADRAKLSKRHGAVALEEFRAGGYLPEAVLNYLALLGWGPGDEQEIFARDELVAAFDLDRVTHSAAVFDGKKLDWVDGEWIRRLDDDDLAGRIADLAPDAAPEAISVAVEIGKTRAVTLHDFVEALGYLEGDAIAFDAASWEKLVSSERAPEILDAAISHLESASEWTLDAIQLQPALEAIGVKPRKGMHVLYTAVEGRSAGFPLFDVIHHIGRERSLARLRAARERLSRT